MPEAICSIIVWSKVGRSGVHRGLFAQVISQYEGAPFDTGRSLVQEPQKYAELVITANFTQLKVALIFARLSTSPRRTLNPWVADPAVSM